MKTLFAKTFMAMSLITGIFSVISCNDNKTSEKNFSIEDVLPNEDSKLSAAWVGKYQGTLPCASCEGIETILILNSDNTYEKHENYLKGEDSSKFEEIGSFSIDDTNTITLKPENGDASGGGLLYKYENDKLFALTLEGEKVSGDLAEHYILKKQ